MSIEYETGSGNSYETILSWEASLRFLMFTYQYFVSEVSP